MVGKVLTTVVDMVGNIDPSLNKAIDGAVKTLDKVDKKSLLTKAALGGMAIGVGKAVKDGSKYLLDLGTEFQKAEKTIRVGTGATGEALKGLNKDFDEVYKSGPWSKENVSSAIADYNTNLGLTGPMLQDLTKQANRVSGLLDEDLNTVVGSSSKAFNQWNIDGDDMGDAMNHVFKVSQATGAGFTDLLKSTQKFGPQMQEMGYSFNETTSLLGQLEKTGVNVPEVMGAMKKSVGALAKEGYSASEGMQVYYDKIKNAGSAAEATTIASEIFGSRAGSSMASAIRNGSLAVDDFNKSMEGSNETIEKSAKDTGTIAGKFGTLKHTAEIALKPMAMTLFDKLNEIMPHVQEALDWVLSHGAIVKGALIGVGSALVGLKVGFAVFDAAMKIKKVSDTVKKAKEAFKGLEIATKLANFRKKMFTTTTLKSTIATTREAIATKAATIAHKASAAASKALAIAQKALNTVMRANPIGLVITAIMALVGGFMILWKKSATFRNFWIGLWDSIKGKVTAAYNFLKPVFMQIGGVFKKAIGPAVSYVKAQIGNLKKIFSGIVTFIKGVFTGNWKKAWQGVKSIFSGVVKGLANVFKFPINAIIGGINKFTSGLKKIKIPDWVPKVGGKGINIPQIPKLASGGFTEGVSIAGEAGTEAVISFDRKYRNENLSYWARAGKMLGASTDDGYRLDQPRSSTMFADFGGIKFAPEINISGDAKKEDIIAALEEAFPELIDLLERWLAERDEFAYGR